MVVAVVLLAAAIVTYGLFLIGLAIWWFIGRFGSYYGGRVDWAVRRLKDARLLFNALGTSIVISAAVGYTVIGVVIALSSVLAPYAAFTFRAQALRIRDSDCPPPDNDSHTSPRRITARRMAATFIAVAVAYVGWAILLGESLNFLEIGVPPAVPSWGGMLADRIALFPFLAIAVTVFAWNRLGHALRDVLAPELRGR